MDNFELIKNFSERLGLNIEKNEDCSYFFNVDERTFTIHDLTECDRIVLMGDLGLPPPQNKESLYKSILEAQHMFKSTGGATISIDPETENFSICKALVSAVLDNDSFFAEVEDFINTFHTWADIIRDYRGNVTTGEPDIGETPPSLNDGFIFV